MSEQGLEIPEGEETEEQAALTSTKEVSEVVELDPEEEEARTSGWVDKDEWVEQGNDADDWVNYRGFNKNGSLFRRINDLEAQTETFDMRLKNVNTVHRVHLNQVLQELQRQKKEAIQDGQVEQVELIDQQMRDQVNSLNQPEDDGSLLLAKWNDDHAWIYDKEDPKSPFAKNAFALEVSARLRKLGLPADGTLPANEITEAIVEVEGKITKRFPEKQVNQRRNDPSITGGGKKSGKKGRTLTVHDLTADEKKILNNPAFAQFDEETRMQMVKDSRIEQ